MKLEKINSMTWAEISKSENLAVGYLGTFITINDEPRFDLLIFRDENDKKHFVIEFSDARLKEIRDPNINGLRLSGKQFKFNGKDTKWFIDLECSRQDYLDEFTGIIKEISRNILLLNNDPITSVIDVIENWKSFLASRVKEVLSEEEQLGLFCELIILKTLCNINPGLALNSWKGPLGEKHDFSFSEWCIEVKGTRSAQHSHWINGIDQLKGPANKSLAFISFLLTGSQSSISIQSLIDSIVTQRLNNKPALVETFYKLLILAGYSRTFAEEYDKLQFDIIDCILFHVNENFPKLTSENLKSQLSSRVSEIRYKIDLQGLHGISFDAIQLGNYFY